MNKIDKNELFGHVSQFLKNKGVELQDGSYTRTILKGCQVLADTINLSQQAMERAKSELDKKLARAREVIHEKTASKAPPVQPQPGQPTPPPPSAQAASTAEPSNASGKPPVAKRVAKRSPKRPAKRPGGKPSKS